MDLENISRLSRRGHFAVLEIVWFLLDVEMKDRWTAERVYNRMCQVTKEAIVDLGKDPDLYFRPLPPLLPRPPYPQKNHARWEEVLRTFSVPSNPEPGVLQPRPAGAGESAIQGSG
jgi:hypothetical protein